MGKTKESKAFLNYMHNELGITKDMIREWTEAAAQRTVERYLEVNYPKDQLPEIIRRAVKDYSWNALLWNDADNLDDKLKELVVKELVSGIKLNVEVGKQNG